MFLQYMTRLIIVIAYEDNGNNQYGTAIVGTVSGTSISFGSPTFETSAIYNLKATYDSTNGKAVITYTGPLTMDTQMLRNRKWY